MAERSGWGAESVSIDGCGSEMQVVTYHSTLICGQSLLARLTCCLSGGHTIRFSLVDLEKVLLFNDLRRLARFVHYQEIVREVITNISI